MRVERADDLVLIHHFIERSNLSALLNQHFPDHGLWQGISGGQLAAGWLCYILSEADHRLCHVQEWAGARLNTLSCLLHSRNLREIDFCDDRLARLLDRYSDAHKWAGFERDFGRQLLKVYTPARNEEGGFYTVRTDSYNVPQFRQATDFFTFGYTKQRRADQPFCKVMMACLDPCPLPLSVELLPGSGPDTDHYLSVINRAKATLGGKGHLFVGDSQLGSRANRRSIAHQQDYYLCPLSLKQCTQDKLYQYIDEVPSPYEALPGIFLDEEDGRNALHYYELPGGEAMADKEAGFRWTERRVLAYSPGYAQGLIASFEDRLEQAEQALKKLVISKRGRRNPKTLEQLISRCAQVLKKYQVEGMFDLDYQEHAEQKTLGKYKDRPQRKVTKIQLHLQVQRQEQHIAQAKKRLGWQLYATNLPTALASAQQVVWLYRDEYRIEHLFDRMINKDVGLLPVYLQKENRIRGLIRLLSVAMQLAMVIQCQVRRQLALQQQQLKGGYAGNKNRSTDQPTIAMILRMFEGISLVWLRQDETVRVLLPDLEKKQQFVLQLLGIPDLYVKVRDMLASREILRER